MKKRSLLLKTFFISSSLLVLTACGSEGVGDDASAETASAEAPGGIQEESLQPIPEPDPVPVPPPEPTPDPIPVLPPVPPPVSNSPALISGVDNGLVTEDVDPDGNSLLEVSGKLSISDSDAGESAFAALASNGRYGNLTIDAAGNWRYTANNNRIDIQRLAAGQVLTDIFTVNSVDGTAHNVSLRIYGVNDTAVISGTDTAMLTEDNDPDGDGLLETGGSLTITDPDTGEAAFLANTLTGSYGNLDIDTGGNWHYASSNNQPGVQGLITGGSITDSFTVSSVGGATHTISITINGANDATAIGGVDSGTVTEDNDPDGDGLLETGGSLTVTDPDAGEASFIQRTTAGQYGVLSINSNGSWNYSANNQNAAIQNLNSGASIVDSYTISSITGATHNVTITIHGIDEPVALSKITLSWIAPVEREDGTPISMAEIAGYRVYYGTTPGNHTNQVDVSGSSTMQVTLVNLSPGTYHIVVTTVDTDGRESAQSPPVSRSL